MKEDIKDMSTQEVAPTRGEKEVREDQAYVASLMKMVHDKKTSGNVVNMVKSGDPYTTIPKAAITINASLEDRVREKGKKPSLETLFMGMYYLVNDLTEVAVASGVMEEPGEKGRASILQSAVESYVQKGLKNKTIDIMELQAKTEQLMTPEQRSQGLQAGAANGVPEQAGTQAAMEQYASQREQQALSKVQQQKAGAMQQAQQQVRGQQVQQGGA